MWKHLLQPFGRGGAEKPFEEEHLIAERMTTVFVEQPLALPGSAKKSGYQYFVSLSPGAALPLNFPGQGSFFIQIVHFFM